jgi:ParB family chromosome partitioning protein
MATTKEVTTRKRLGRGLGSLLSSLAPVEIAPPESTRPPIHSPPVPEPPPHRPAPAAVATIEDMPTPSASAEAGESLVENGQSVAMIGLDKVRPNPRQPRTQFNEAGLDELAASIRTAGLMQPVIVRPRPAGEFELIAGERRWRAAQKLGLPSIPALVRDLDDRTAAEWSLVENIQREDLNPMEQAEAFAVLVQDFGLTHQELADRVGLNRSTISNALRLLELDEQTRQALRSGRLSAGHAKALLSITNSDRRRALAQQAIRREWSVRELEQRAREAGQAARTPAAATAHQSAHLRDLQGRLGAHLGTKVTIVTGRKKGSGKLIIDFFDLDQFEGLMQRLGFEQD